MEDGPVSQGSGTSTGAEERHDQPNEVRKSGVKPNSGSAGSVLGKVSPAETASKPQSLGQLRHLPNRQSHVKQLPAIATTQTFAHMADLTTAFNALLKGREAPPTKPFNLDTADEFLKEAHRIVCLRQP